MRLWIVILPNRRVGSRARSVEVAQRNPLQAPIGSGAPQKLFGFQFRLAIGADGLQGMIFVELVSLRLAIDCAA